MNNFDEILDDYMPDDFFVMCGWCNGSGQGSIPESRCPVCGGSGEMRVDYDAPTYDDIFYNRVDDAMND